ncbi:MAG: ABC transporter permease, partial [Spirochaetaceae bacterium]
MLNYAIKELFRRPRRAIATIAGYTVAVAALVILLSTLENQIRLSDSVLTGTGTHFIAYIPLCGNETCENIVLDEKNEGFYANMVKSKLMSTDLAVLARQSPAVADASGFLLFKITDDSGNSLFLGGLPDAATVSMKNNSCSATDIVAGRFFKPGDKNSILLEESYAAAHALSLDSVVSFSGRQFNVIGIINPGIRPAKADVYIQVEEAGNVINSHLRIPLSRQMNILMVESAGASLHEQAMKDIQSLLGSTSLVSTYGCFKPAARVMGINDAGLNLA